MIKLLINETPFGRVIYNLKIKNNQLVGYGFILTKDKFLALVKKCDAFIFCADVKKVKEILNVDDNIFKGVTQADLAKIKKVSRQAIHHQIKKGKLSFSIRNKTKFITEGF